MESIWRDIRYNLRGFARSPGFVSIGVLIMALGIAANTAIFSVIDAVLIRPLPIKDPARVMIVHDQLPKLNLPRTEVSGPQFEDYSRRTDIFESTAALSSQTFSVTGAGAPEQVLAARITNGFFPLLGVEPVIGRSFRQEDDVYGAHKAALLSFRAWDQLFGRDARVVGQSMTLNGAPYEVIGVLPPSIQQVYPKFDIWIPMAFSPAELSEARRFSLAYGMIARLKAGVGLREAQSAMSALAKESLKGDDAGGFNVEVRPIMDEKVGDVREPLYILLAAVFVVLMISCANIASLLVARASGRTREIAIRIAVGAGRLRLVRQLLIESVMLAILGGALGAMLANWGVKALLRLAPANLPRLSEITVNGRVLLFTTAVSLGAGILFGLFPAFAASRTNLVDSLKESGRSDSAGRSRQRFRSALVIAEVALAFGLLFSAGLLLRSFARLLEVKPGFDPHNMLTMRIALPHNKQPDYIHAATFFGALLPHLQALPGVQQAALATEPPFTPGGDNSMFFIRNYQSGRGRPEPHADYTNVSADYFKTMGIPLIKGREFTESDMNKGWMSDGSSVIIDENLARIFWPKGDALGSNIGWSGGQGPWATIIGIVGSVKPGDLSADSKGMIYFADYYSEATMVIRTANDPHNLIQAVQEQVRSVDPNQPVYDIQTMDERVASSLASNRFATILLAIFAAVALVLAGIGL
ncbi:MAG TPA: ABC transporter permease, partial [Blastocatellia bacterium]|nr:ABC transporter permease [Blastocatellia bacterium]